MDAEAANKSFFVRFTEPDLLIKLIVYQKNFIIRA